MLKVIGTILVFLLSSTNVLADGMTFGIAGKQVDDINFIAVWKSCLQEAQKYGDTCLHIGEKGPAHFRIQDKSIAEAINKGIDGLAVSVTNSEWLYKHALTTAVKKNIPLITFDSDLDKNHAHMRSAYVGMDNLQVGREMGRIAQKLRPQGGTVWLMSGVKYSTNLNKRLMGIRQTLSGNLQFPEGKKLSGKGGWKEHNRSPWYCWDDYARSLKQMKVTLTDPKVDVFISVGHWPIINADSYRQTISSIRNDVPDTHKKTIIIGVGELLPEQMELLRENIVHAYISLDFEEMGRKSYHYLKKLAMGEKIPPVTHTGIKVYLWNDRSSN